jgi:hypothetical protein
MSPEHSPLGKAISAPHGLQMGLSVGREWTVRFRSAKREEIPLGSGRHIAQATRFPVAGLSGNASRISTLERRRLSSSRCELFPMIARPSKPLASRRRSTARSHSNWNTRNLRSRSSLNPQLPGFSSYLPTGCLRAISLRSCRYWPPRRSLS